MKRSFKNPLLEIDYSSKPYKAQNDDSEEVSPFDFIAEEKNLIDFLEEQIGYLKISKEMRFLCNYLINNLDKEVILLLQKMR